MHVKSFSGWMYSNLLLTRLWIMFLFPQPSRLLDANPKKSSLWSPQTTVGHMGYTDRFQTTQVIYVVNVFQRFPTPSTCMLQSHTNKNQLWMLSSNTARLQCSLHITGVIPRCLGSLLEWSPCFLVVYSSYQHCTVDWIWNPNITSKLNPIIVMYNTSIYICTGRNWSYSTKLLFTPGCFHTDKKSKPCWNESFTKESSCHSRSFYLSFPFPQWSNITLFSHVLVFPPCFPIPLSPCFFPPHWPSVICWSQAQGIAKLLSPGIATSQWSRCRKGGMFMTRRRVQGMYQPPVDGTDLFLMSLMMGPVEKSGKII